MQISLNKPFRGAVTAFFGSEPGTFVLSIQIILLRSRDMLKFEDPVRNPEHFSVLVRSGSQP